MSEEEVPMDVLLDMIEDSMDPDEVVDILEISTEELLDKFPAKVTLKKHLIKMYFGLN